jgi:hypothetical protein
MASTSGASSSGASRAAAKPAGASRGAAKPAKPAKPARPAKKGALAAGAARASGERAKRRSTPLIASAGAPTPLPPVVQAVAPDVVAVAPDASTTQSSGKHRPQPVAKVVPTRKAVSRSGSRTTKPASRRAPRAR